MSGAPQGTDAGGLAEALAARGYACAVEARERLALLMPTAQWPALDEAAARRGLFGLAAQFGFTHVALEVPNDDAPAVAAGAAAAGAPDAARG